VLDFPESILLQNERINKLIPIPRDPTKEELAAMWTRVREVQAEDQRRLEAFYKHNIQRIQAKIENLAS